jgi:tetratricopeptide (TPR) repeat protein
LQNIAAGNLDLAKRRLEYVIQIYPSFPGAANKLAEVMVSIAQTNQSVSNSNTVPVVVATLDTRNQSTIFAQAQQQLASEDWQNLYVTVNALRNVDPTYEALKVDGMYYLALRNVGIANIKAGNLEMGIYQFAVAEQIAPIDADAVNWRQYAVMYIDGEANWGVNWQVAVNNFSILYQSLPYFSDFNGVTSKDRYANSLVGLGDTLETTYNWCDAATNYGESMGIMTIAGVSDKLSQAQEYCKNPPATPTPEGDVTPTP